MVDEKIGRMLAALGDAGDPESLRSRTVIVRISDHGELGMSHGGLRQKMFNAYEESIRVPFVISNPVLFPEPRESDAPVSLVDLVPTLLGLAGRPGDPERFDGLDLGPLVRGEAEALRDAVLFTYDDHQAGTAFQNVSGSPTGSAACATRAGSTRSTSTRPARRLPSSSSTTSTAIRTRRSTWWTSTGPWPDQGRRAGARAAAAAPRARLRGQRHPRARAAAPLTARR